MHIPSFIAGWFCGWGTIVLVGILAGLLLRAMRRGLPAQVIRHQNPRTEADRVDPPYRKTA